MTINEPGNVADTRNVEPVNLVYAAGSLGGRQSKGEEKKRKRSYQKRVCDYFHPLSKAVEASNLRLIQEKLPYRFRVFKRLGEVFIELSILDSEGKVKEKQRRNITRSDFNRIIDDVAAVEGLFFDHIV